MGRIGISFERVCGACDKLYAGGRTVTNAKVRKIIGNTGSYSTISKHIKKWRAKRMAHTILSKDASIKYCFNSNTGIHEFNVIEWNLNKDTNIIAAKKFLCKNCVNIFNIEDIGG